MAFSIAWFSCLILKSSISDSFSNLLGFFFVVFNSDSVVYDGGIRLPLVSGMDNLLPPPIIVPVPPSITVPVPAAEDCSSST